MPAELQALGAPGGRLRLRVSRPAKGTAVVKVNGEIDLDTAPRLWEMLSERLHGRGAKLIVNLSEVEFFGATGIRVLQRAQLLADETGTLLFVFPGESRSARRMLDLYDGEGLRALASTRGTGTEWVAGS
ncbi:STAS domain-containing protein [Amycolatopsis pittospori]|uniref:STAS domain-containing protein n=1 Tax=Amycolatopsis pittospori TaxID=2749434 RepID=UPI002E281FA1|nr:STAS domain-containing protein [Amycolatopsis pittospori]